MRRGNAVAKCHNFYHQSRCLAYNHNNNISTHKSLKIGNNSPNQHNICKSQVETSNHTSNRVFSGGAFTNATVHRQNHNNNSNMHFLQSIIQYSSSPAATTDDTHGNIILQKESKKLPHLLSLREIYDYSQSGNFDEFASFLWREIPTRVAHRAIELQNLPYGLSTTPAIEKVRNLYTHSFHLFRLLPNPVTFEQKQAFAQEIADHFVRLKPATELLAAGIAECISNTPSQALTIQTCPFLNGFLDRFHAARIGTRLLTGQFIELHKIEKMLEKSKENSGNNSGSGSGTVEPNMKSSKVGLIDRDCRVRNVFEMAQDDAARLCYGNFGKCPEVNIEDESNVIFTYVTSDLHYILFELVKNSMRAVCEYHSELSEDDLPPINVVIVNSSQDREVKIKISDEGGGIPLEDMQKIFLYSFTTVNYKRPKHRRKKKGINSNNDDDDDDDSDMETVPTLSFKDELSKFSNVRQMSSKIESGNNMDVIPMAGFGYGLPLSRLYARYFGGDLQVMSMDGHGSDAYLTLKYLSLTAPTSEQIDEGKIQEEKGF